MGRRARHISIFLLEKAAQGLAGEPKATESPLAGKRFGRFSIPIACNGYQ
jgi:hypothetical protein